MKKLLLGTVALAALGVPAIAADMGVRPVARPVVAYTNWTGCHIGGLVGLEYASNNGYNTTGASTVIAFSGVNLPLNGAAVAAGQPTASGFNFSGFTGGGYIGCDYQVSNWVFGVEGDWSVDNNSGQSGNVLPTLATSLGTFFRSPFNYTEAQERWYATARGRLGYAVDKWLFFVTGGAAWTKVDSSAFDVVNVACGTPCRFINDSNRVNGWTVGGGFDYAITGASLMPGWSVRVEYLYIGLPSFTTFTPSAQFSTVLGSHITNQNTQYHDNVVRVGFAYKFGNYAASAVYR